MAVGLRLGTNLYDQHRCPSVTMADCRGTHGLLCKTSSARIARLSYINDIIHRALVSLSRTDGKRSDGLTLIPWQFGKNLIWNITVVNTFDINFSNSWQCSLACRLAQISDIRRYGHYAHFLTSGFRYPWSHLFKSTCVL